ncbi:MAG: lysophospholipid transporter LplT [Massilia sp.]
MIRGFYCIMAAQFFSSLADNALLFVAIDLLTRNNSPAFLSPMLKQSFVLFYILLAAFVGAFADSMPKGRVMFIANAIKISGCALLFFDVYPLLAYGVVGFGAAVYSPAKYGILTELLPPEKLIPANGWIEGLTVGSIILGTVLGGALVSGHTSALLHSLGVPAFSSGVNATTQIALTVLILIYMLAALFNLFIPNSGAKYPPQVHGPIKLLIDFSSCARILWRDRLGQISLGVTTLFWGAGATLQYIVLGWAQRSLHIPFEKATSMVGIVAVGMAIGAIAATRFVTLNNTLKVLPLGVVMGLTITAMPWVHTPVLAYPMLVLIGAVSGFFVVPMNALLQHRGKILMSAGHSIAVQNFNENLSILYCLAVYALLLKLNIDLNVIIVLFGLFVSGIMYWIMRHHRFVSLTNPGSLRVTS